MPDDLLEQLAMRRAMARMPSTEAGVFMPQGAGMMGGGQPQQGGGLPPLSATPNPQAPLPMSLPNPMLVPPAQGAQQPLAVPGGQPQAAGAQQSAPQPMPLGGGPRPGPTAGAGAPPQQAPGAEPQAPGGLNDLRPPWQAPQTSDLYANRGTNLAAGAQGGRELRPAPPTNPGSRGPGKMPSPTR